MDTLKQSYICAITESEDKIESLENDSRYHEALVKILNGIYFYKEEHEDFPVELQELLVAIKYNANKVNEIKEKITDEQKIISFCKNMISNL